MPVSFLGMCLTCPFCSNPFAKSFEILGVNSRGSTTVDTDIFKYPYLALHGEFHFRITLH